MQLTAAGRLVAASCAVSLAIAYLLGYPRLAVLGVGGLAALAGGASWVARRPRVELAREVFPARVRRGEPAVGMLTIRNGSRVLGLRVAASETFGGSEIAVPVPYLPAGARREVGYQLPTSRRGVIEVGPLRWERTDALGLVRRRYTLAGQQRLFVHPFVHQVPLSAALRARRWDSSTSDAAPDGTITFHTLREYVPGDDLRFIHWRSSARIGTLMVRRNIDVSLPRTTAVLVTSSAAYPDADAFEEAVEVAASAVVAAAGERLPALLVTTAGQALACAGGQDDARRLLDFLAGVSCDDGTGLGLAADQLRRAEAGGVLLVATGSLSEEDLATLRALATGYDQVVVALLAAHASGSPAELMSEPGWPELTVCVLHARTGAQFCARWQELVSR